jgi:hypothetical protein
MAYGRGELMVVWNRIIFPDGSSMRLEGMASHARSLLARADYDTRWTTTTGNY